jgi:NTP pyrophosphatase (non-canonical NTP hydrolase)
MQLKNEFAPIREWAENRGLYEKGDVKTQFIKLQEECGELANAILKDNKAEFIDAIGDIVVVLTNLTELSGFKIECKDDIQSVRSITIEDCINSAYTVIKNRSGSMQNGTFIKDAK